MCEGDEMLQGFQFEMDEIPMTLYGQRASELIRCLICPHTALVTIAISIGDNLLCGGALLLGD